MYYAVDTNKNRICIDEVDSNTICFCPICGKELIKKMGSIRAHHFAHKKKSECDDWNYEMSEWHRNWQSKFPSECREVVVTKNDIMHRADVLINGTVIEFQHSNMSMDEFNERNTFYNNAGYRVVWLFDFVEEYQSGKMRVYSQGYNYRWKYPRSTFAGFVPKGNDKVKVFFQLSYDLSDGNCGIEQLTWISDDSKYFYTGNDVSYDESEFLELFTQRTTDKETIIKNTVSQIAFFTLQELLANTKRECVIAKNVRTGAIVKVWNRDFYNRSYIKYIEGYYKNLNNDFFSNEKKRINNWKRREWELVKAT